MSKALTDEELAGHEMPPTERLARKIGEEAVQELLCATRNFGAFASSHEGFAVLKEEVDELWDEVKRNPRKIEPPYGLNDGKCGLDDAYRRVREWQDAERRRRLRKEAIQVAAMALRFVVDVCDAPPRVDKTAAPTKAAA